MFPRCLGKQRSWSKFCGQYCHFKREYHILVYIRKGNRATQGSPRKSWFENEAWGLENTYSLPAPNDPSLLPFSAHSARSVLFLIGSTTRSRTRSRAVWSKGEADASKSPPLTAMSTFTVQIMESVWLRGRKTDWEIFRRAKRAFCSRNMPRDPNKRFPNRGELLWIIVQ